MISLYDGGLSILNAAKPEWLKVRAPVGEGFLKVRAVTKCFGVTTVCDASHCPNISDCWCRGHASFMVLGDVCTRRCAYCAVRSGEPKKVDLDEPERVAEAVNSLGFDYVVITSVTRDDLPDQGASHFSAVVSAVRERCPGTRVELLIPDMQADAEALSIVADSRPDVLGHNIETVRRLQPIARDRRCSYERSLQVLRTIKRLDSTIVTKSSMMLGLGEKREEVSQTLRDLRGAGVDIVAIGQYLKPTGNRLEVEEYVTPEVFEDIREEAEGMGFRYASSAPMVRSSYNAHEAFMDRGR